MKAAVLALVLLTHACVVTAQLPIVEQVITSAAKKKRSGQQQTMEFTSIGTNVTTSAALNFATPTAVSVPMGACLIAVVSHLATDPTNIYGNNLAWTLAARTNFNAGANRLSVYYTSPSNNVSASSVQTVQFAASQVSCGIYVCQFTYVAAVSFINQATVATNAIANPAVTLSAFNADAKSAGLFVVNSVDSNGSYGAPEAGWTEVCDSGVNNDPMTIWVAYRMATTDNSLSCTASAQQWGACGMEIRPVQ